MARPPHAREGILDAFETLLVDEGEKGATIEAIARAAGVSKGGLLYHFGSKEALETGLLERLEHLVEEDVALMLDADDGPVSYFLRTSVTYGGPLDSAIIAVSRLAQGGSARANTALRGMRERWSETLRPHTVDKTALDLVLLVSDGLYFNNALDDGGFPAPVPEGVELAALIRLVESVARV